MFFGKLLENIFEKYNLLRTINFKNNFTGELGLRKVSPNPFQMGLVRVVWYLLERSKTFCLL